MTNKPGKSISLGELVAAAYDRTRVIEVDRRSASRLASRTLARWLGRANRHDILHSLSCR